MIILTFFEKNKKSIDYYYFLRNLIIVDSLDNNKCRFGNIYTSGVLINEVDTITYLGWVKHLNTEHMLRTLNLSTLIERNQLTMREFPNSEKYTDNELYWLYVDSINCLMYKLRPYKSLLSEKTLNIHISHNKDSDEDLMIEIP